MKLKDRLRLERPIVFFDIESTGIDTYEDRIVELAMVRIFADGTQPDIFSRRFNPGIAIKPEATEVHGITDQDVRGEKPFGEFAKYVEEFLDGSDLGGFNIRRFDVPMLMNELVRYKCSLHFPLNIVDCCDIFHKEEPRDLAAAYSFYVGDELEDAHSASADVEATIAVFAGQIEQYGLDCDAAKIQEKYGDPDTVDLAGKLKRDGKAIIVTFGKYRGTPLDELPLSYLQWMKKEHVIGPDAEHFVKEAITTQWKVDTSYGRR